MSAKNSGTNVFAELGFSAVQAENLRIRSELMLRIRRELGARQLTQSAAAAAFGVSQPRLSDLVTGKLHKFSLDALVAMLVNAGLHVAISIPHVQVSIEYAEGVAIGRLVATEALTLTSHAATTAKTLISSTTSGTLVSDSSIANVADTQLALAA